MASLGQYTSTFAPSKGGGVVMVNDEGNAASGSSTADEEAGASTRREDDVAMRCGMLAAERGWGMSRSMR